MRGCLLVDAEENIAQFFKELNHTAALFRGADPQTTVRRNHYIFLATYQYSAAFGAGCYDISGIQTAAANRDLGHARAQNINSPGAFGEFPLRCSCVSGSSRG